MDNYFEVVDSSLAGISWLTVDHPWLAIVVIALLAMALPVVACHCCLEQVPMRNFRPSALASSLTSGPASSLASGLASGLASVLASDLASGLASSPASSNLRASDLGAFGLVAFSTETSGQAPSATGPSSTSSSCLPHCRTIERQLSTILSSSVVRLFRPISPPSCSFPRLISAFFEHP